MKYQPARHTVRISARKDNYRPFLGWKDSAEEPLFNTWAEAYARLLEIRREKVACAERDLANYQKQLKRALAMKDPNGQ